MFDALKSLYSKVSDRSILSLFDDPNRAGEFSVRFDHMLFDYSKTNIDNAARTALLDLARDRGVAQKRDAMFQGAKINDTEGRAVLHTALRNLDGDAVHRRWTRCHARGAANPELDGRFCRGGAQW